MASGVKRIIKQAYHRNGVGGASAIVTLFEAYGHRGRFLAVTVNPDRPENAVTYGTEAQRNLRDFATHTVVLNLAETMEGNIAFGEGNSWRGADEYGEDIARAWRDKCRSEEFPYDPFDEAWKPAEVVTQ